MTGQLASFPLQYQLTASRWDRLKRPAQFLAQIRSRLILQALNTAVILLSAFIVTISGECSCVKIGFGKLTIDSVHCKGLQKRRQ